MTLKEIYYAARPMAAHRAREEFRVPPAISFIAAAVVSVIGGVACGFEMWILAGFRPDNSGGTLIFVFGSCAMSILSLVLGFVWKNRAVLYGLNSFTFLTVLLLLLSIVKTKFG